MKLSEMQVARFWAKVDATGPDCWPWTAAVGTHGYGAFYVGRSRATREMRLAHRVAYELRVGRIRRGQTIDHLCRQRLCCNPAHMEVVSLAENVRRSGSAARATAASAVAKRARTHCCHGHAFTEANTYWYRGCRQCQRCRTDRNRARAS